MLRMIPERREEEMYSRTPWSHQEDSWLVPERPTTACVRAKEQGIASRMYDSTEQNAAGVPTRAEHNNGGIEQYSEDSSHSGCVKVVSNHRPTKWFESTRN